MLSKPSHLKPGDQVGIIAPGAIFDKKKFRLGIDLLKTWNLKPVFAPNLFAKDFIFSGTVKERTESFYKMAQKPDIKALWCVRGGYGSYAVAQELSKLKIPAPSKILIGISDITALHLLLTQKWKWTVLHGPLIDRLNSPYQPLIEKKVLQKTLFDSDFRFQMASGLTSIALKKKAQGVMTGGNLATIVSSLGSQWEINTDNKIILLEDIGERAYRLDRYLTQLRAAGKFEKVKAIVFGDFTECLERNGRPRWKEVLRRHFGDSSFPVVWGLKTGHGALRLAVPLGVNATVDTRGKPVFSITESLFREE